MTQPGFRIRPFTAKERGVERKRFQVVGYLGSERIRKRFASREEAVGAKLTLPQIPAEVARCHPDFSAFDWANHVIVESSRQPDNFQTVNGFSPAAGR